MDRFTIVMSATVKPEGVPLSVRSDPKVRENDYLESVLFYLEAYPEITRVVFIENSGWPLDRLREAADRGNVHQKKIEFIGLDINAKTGARGKGYGEMRLLHEGLEGSQLLKESSHLLKVTGRLRLLNLTKILRRVKGEFDLLGDVTDYGLYRVWKKKTGRYCENRWCDTRFLGISVKYFEQRLRGAFEEVDDAKGYMVEHLIYDRIIADQRDWRVIYRLPVEPRWAGISGTYNTAYSGKSLKDRVRLLSRAAFRFGDRIIGARFDLA
jgi:hypothetical protein